MKKTHNVYGGIRKSASRRRKQLALALAIEQAGVSVAYLQVEGAEVKVISNGMVDALGYLPGFTEEELEDLGINEKVSFKVLTEISMSPGFLHLFQKFFSHHDFTVFNLLFHLIDIMLRQLVSYHSSSNQ